METPFFSIVIPTYNRPEQLFHCLQALTRLDYPGDRFEVIVVDDGSPISLKETIDPFHSQLNLTVLRQDNAGPATARNTGADRANGQFLAFTDDDCMPTPEWLTALAAQLMASPDSLVGGTTLNGVPDNPFTTASQLLVDFLYDYYNQKTGQPTFLTSNNFALATDRFRAIGGFDTGFPLAAAEDREFCDRWLHHGGTILYAPTARIVHYHYLQLSTFWKQHFNYGRGAFHFYQIRGQRSQSRLQVEPFSFYLNLLIYPLRSSQSQCFFLIVLMFISQLANTLGFSLERQKQKLNSQLSR